MHKTCLAKKELISSLKIKKLNLSLISKRANFAGRNFKTLGIPFQTFSNRNYRFYSEKWPFSTQASLCPQGYKIYVEKKYKNRHRFLKTS